eukprot:786470-Rhodomonas_salina.4
MCATDLPPVGGGQDNRLSRDDLQVGSCLVQREHGLEPQPVRRAAASSRPTRRQCTLSGADDVASCGVDRAVARVGHHAGG